MNTKKPNIISTLIDIFSQVKKNTELLQNLQNQPKNEPVAPPAPKPLVHAVRVSTESNGDGWKEAADYQIPIPPEFVGKLARVSNIKIRKHKGEYSGENSEVISVDFITLPESLNQSYFQGYDTYTVSSSEYLQTDRLFIIEVIDAQPMAV